VVSRGAASTVGATLAVLSMMLVPGAAGATPRKLFTVSFSGTVAIADSEAQERTPPSGCVGTSTDTFRLNGSARITPIAARLPLIEHGEWSYFVFPADVSGLAPVMTQEAAGTWSVEPDSGGGQESCVFKPSTASAPCPLRKTPAQLAKSSFSLFPDPQLTSRFLVYDDDHNIIEGSCEPLYEAAAPQVLQAEFLTSLHVSTVKRLGKGRSVTIRETIAVPHSLNEPGTKIAASETLTFALTVKRVR